MLFCAGKNQAWLWAILSSTKESHTTNEFRFLLLADLTKSVHTDSSKHYFCSSYNCILCIV